MDADDLLQSLQSLSLPKNHATVGLSNLIATNRQYRSLFVHRRLPDVGFTDTQIQLLLLTLSTLDTNNDTAIQSTGGGEEAEDGSMRWCGVGEREGRVYSSLVARRHYGMSHGIGRSGDITEPQPKAVGSSTMAKLTLHLALDATRRGSGLDGKTSAAHGILLPLCTGMSMSLVLSSLRTKLSEDERGEKDVVLWSRIDQKSCYKAILSAGLRCVVVPTKIESDTDQVVTDLAAMESALQRHQGKVLAVITTMSCFAPRVPDQVDEVARLCKREGVAHVINNAYGLQCERTCKLINRACVVGRVDAIVCSTDKNFLVPVGGAIVMSPNESVIKTVGKVYAGRASSAPILDLFITLLSMGLNGYKRVLFERKRILETKFQRLLGEVASKYGERLLNCPKNTISFGMTLDTLAREREDDEEESAYLNRVAEEITYFGSMLFTRCVSGTRVIPRGVVKVMGEGEEFVGFGSSTVGFGNAYLTAACAIGLTEGEVDEFFVRLDKTMKDFFAKRRKKEKRKKAEEEEAKEEKGEEKT